MSDDGLDYGSPEPMAQIKSERRERSRSRSPAKPAHSRRREHDSPPARRRSRSKSPPRMYSVVVRELQMGTTEQELREKFAKFGQVGDSFMPFQNRKDIAHFKSHGFTYGFVRFLREDERRDCVDYCKRNGFTMNGREVKVGIAHNEPGAMQIQRSAENRRMEEQRRQRRRRSQSPRREPRRAYTPPRVTDSRERRTSVSSRHDNYSRPRITDERVQVQREQPRRREFTPPRIFDHRNDSQSHRNDSHSHRNDSHSHRPNIRDEREHTSNNSRRTTYGRDEPRSRDRHFY